MGYVEGDDMSKTHEEKRELLADYAHRAWAGWMEYLFLKGKMNSDGSFTIERDSVDRWKRQAGTPYCDLPDKEKTSDRVEADEMLELIS